ncbi:hypothetical protein IEQ34_013436 [Dendrobium chrysotoxum]|uniref:Uncharacterized protein n=1 Tax=Dendrobium chrysotoxum TaxID=161865 RepID=A0AAV7GPS0_DENCH|nr:hypothetical protein IEQ34_013436 [Dendrobium chrysotoxum]
MKLPARSDRACCPPSGYVTVYEFSLRAGLQFPPASELINILMICGCLSRMGRLFSDAQGRISFRSKWLDICTRDPSKGWISNFFYVQNDWNLQEKWGKLKELSIPLHIGAEDLFRILKLPDLDALHYEKSVRVSEVIPQKRHSKRPGSEEGLQAPRKRKAYEILIVVSKGPRVSPPKSYIQEDVLNHQCIGRRRAEELLEQHSDFKLEIIKILNDWNNEFVKVKYLQGEYNKKYNSKVKEMKFKKSYTFKIIIENYIQDARNHIYDVEVKALDAECIEDGFIRGFMKGILAVRRKTGAEITGLTPIQASGDASSDSGGEELESELQQAFTLEEDEGDIEIL